MMFMWPMRFSRNRVLRDFYTARHASFVILDSITLKYDNDPDLKLINEEYTADSRRIAKVATAMGLVLGRVCNHRRLSVKAKRHACIDAHTVMERAKKAIYRTQKAAPDPLTDEAKVAFQDARLAMLETAKVMLNYIFNEDAR